MPEWTLHIESPAGTTRDEETLDRFHESLAANADALGPAVGMVADTGSLTATFQVEAETQDDAALRGLLAYWRAIGDAGLELRDDSRVEIAPIDAEGEAEAFAARLQFERV